MKLMKSGFAQQDDGAGLRRFQRPFTDIEINKTTAGQVKSLIVSSQGNPALLAHENRVKLPKWGKPAING